jgi:mono/diheme cytochrome c family protein
MSLEPNKPLTQTMDEAEPTSGVTPAPILLIGLFALLLFVGLTYLESHGGGFNAQVYPPYESWKDVDGHQVRDVVEEFRIKGQKIYQSTCSACHQPNGMGSAAQNAPPLAGSEWVNAEGPNRVIRIVLSGLTGPVKVKGQDFGAGIMAPWRDAYTDEEIAAILTYIRKEWGNNAPAITPEQVKAIRDKTTDHSAGHSWTSDELLKIPEKN